MQVLYIIFYIFSAFIGYALGRIGHIYHGYKDTPHHWIYGLILIIFGLIFYKYFILRLAFYFGIGSFISDLKDFLQLKFWGPDEEGKKKFWGID